MEEVIESPYWNKMAKLYEEETLGDHEYPRVTIILPTYNNARNISPTIESLIHQNYPDYEILVVDAGSKDRTIEIIKSYRDPHIRLFAVKGYNRYEMINKGISLAKGTYINILFPGDYYIQKEVLRSMMGFAVKMSEPYLVYCGCLLREAKKDVKILFRQLDAQLLKHGQQPTSLESMWFKNSVFLEIGKFNPNYQLRGGFDFLCRFIENGSLTFQGLNRVLTDYDLRGVTSRMVVTHFYETLMIIIHYFGLVAAFLWLIRQKDIARYFKLWWRSIKVTVKGSQA